MSRIFCNVSRMEMIQGHAKETKFPPVFSLIRVFYDKQVFNLSEHFRIIRTKLREDM